MAWNSPLPQSLSAVSAVRCCGRHRPRRCFQLRWRKGGVALRKESLNQNQWEGIPVEVFRGKGKVMVLTAVHPALALALDLDLDLS